MNREIYSIAFNRSVTDKGVVKMLVYTLGAVSQNGFRIPEKITQYHNAVVVEFTDSTRHWIPYSNDVELFDRPVVEPIPSTTDAVK